MLLNLCVCTFIEYWESIEKNGFWQVNCVDSLGCYDSREREKYPDWAMVRSTYVRNDDELSVYMQFYGSTN